jgi:hypothetical protein
MAVNLCTSYTTDGGRRARKPRATLEAGKEKEKMDTRSAGMNSQPLIRIPIFFFLARLCPSVWHADVSKWPAPLKAVLFFWSSFFSYFISE